MATIQEDQTSLYVGAIDIDAHGKGFTEEYDLKAADGQWNTAKQQLQRIARCRAAVLGRGAKVSYAVVSERGPARKSLVVIDTPLMGTVGVQFRDAGVTELATTVNTLATKLNFRFQTAVGDFAVRGFRGVCDAWINQYQWRPTTGTAGQFVVLKSDFNLAWDDSRDLPVDFLWEFSKTYASGYVDRTFYTYEQAWNKLLKAIVQFTVYRRPTVNSEGVVTPGVFTAVDWNEVIFRGVQDRAAGLPSGR